jgi:hypothetical protein
VRAIVAALSSQAIARPSARAIACAAGSASFCHFHSYLKRPAAAAHDDSFMLRSNFFIPR